MNQQQFHPTRQNLNTSPGLQFTLPPTPSTSNHTTHLFVVHDAIRRGQDKDAKLTGGHELGNPVFVFVHLEVEPGRDNAALVQTARQVDNDLASAAVIDDFEFANVAWER
jgi:hypothetical protein